MAAERDVLITSEERYGALTVGGNYAKVAEGLGVASQRVETPDGIVPAIHQAIETTTSGAPFLIEYVTKEGYDFSRY
jgi:thiamine pyrophosphate-dependent acetolactate synthase large subunit-like protein